MSQQKTLRESVSFSGTGLHSGQRVNMTLLPGAANTGIRFRRLDLEGKPEIEARVEHVSETQRSTSLAKGNVKVQTVEHILATFAGYEIDNAIIELDANEPPIGDGSAREYCRLVQKAGTVLLPERRETYRLSEPIKIEVGESMLSIFPDDKFRISCTSADRKGRFTQCFSVELTPENWQNELADARTFCFFDEIEFLIKNGLIRGGSLENAVVIRDDVVLTTEPLRFPEEFVRHKILDIVGDLSLAGQPLCGHVIALRPSHSANCELARQIVAQMRRPIETARAFTPPPAPVLATIDAKASVTEAKSDPILDRAALGIDELLKILPHRYPFLMVDRITQIDGNRVTGIKNVTANEPYFQGHFPGHPIMPGVLQLEAIAQVAGILMLKHADNWGKIAYFMSAESVKWRKPVRPGDQLVIEVELLKSRGKIGKAKGVCRVDGEEVSEAQIAFVLVDR